MDKKTRSYEEIITLQDKAIEALTQANAALVMALEAVKRARAEHGFPVLLPGIGGLVGNQGGTVVYPAITNPTYTPNTTDGIQWSGQFSNAGGGAGVAGGSGIVTINTSGNIAAKTATTQSLISQAHSQTDMAKAYITAFQSYQKEHDAQVGQHVSLCQDLAE